MSDRFLMSYFPKRLKWIRVAATLILLASSFISSRAADRAKSDSAGIESSASIPPDCDKPELLVNGRPSMSPAGADLAFGFSINKHEFKVGDPIELHVWVDNRGDKPAEVLTCSDLGIFKARGFNLFEADGRRVLNPQDAKLVEECKTDPRRANFLRGGWDCTRNLMITIPAHTCVTRDGYDFTTVPNPGYDLPPGEYTLRPRSKWKVAYDDICEPRAGEPIRREPGDITFTVTQP
jgi:hypothetical protein